MLQDPANAILPTSKIYIKKPIQNCIFVLDSEIDLEGDPPIQNMRNPNPGGGKLNFKSLL